MNIRKQLLYVAITIGFIATHEIVKTEHRTFYNATMADAEVTVDYHLGPTKTFLIPAQRSFSAETNIAYVIKSVKVKLSPQQIGGFQYVGVTKRAEINLDFTEHHTIGTGSAAFIIFGAGNNYYLARVFKLSKNLISAPIPY
ncbi:MAG: hypothetical protein WBQ73_01045 [Candidatus Babeliales bacterium]